MRLVWIALALGMTVALAVYTFSPARRIQMFAALQRSKWFALQGFAFVSVGYAVPIYFALLLAS
jgi:hypothetical protein